MGISVTSSGIYTVVNKTAAGTYVLRNEQNEIGSKRYPPSLLKFAPQYASDMEEDYFIVDSIVAHDLADDNTYLYKTKWKGYDSSYDTWEPPESFVDPKIISDYWRKIGVIPESRKEINKANKKTLKNLNDNNNSISRKRRRSNNNTKNRNSKKIKHTN